MSFSLIAGAAILLSFSSPASACDAVYLSIPGLFADTSVTFIGKVIESPWKPNGGATVTTVVRFSVERNLRRTPESEVTVPAFNPCTYAFLEGETYLVHGRSNIDGTISTGYAWRPMLIRDAGEVLKYVEATLANRPVGVLSGPVPKMVVTLRLQSSTGIAIRTEVQTGFYEIVAPPGEYTAWLERDGNVIGERKTVRLGQGKAVYLPLGPDR
jgi:hypothetical protein